MNVRITNRIASALAVLLSTVLAPMAQSQDLTLPQQGADPVVLSVPQGTPDAGMLRVFLAGAEMPMAGRYTPTLGTVTFAPAFGFEPGQDYVAHVLKAGETTRTTFRISDDLSVRPAAVTHIYPSGDILPENTLRFYIHFSVPMQPQVAFDYIQLRDASGTLDAAAFMRFKQELWNEDRTRLTVLVDPGRIKREVATNVELGPALRAGQQYTLAVAGGWPSANAASVLPAFTKTFQVSEALRSLPDTDLWTVNAPCGGTKDPTTVTFDRPFDRHLLARALRFETEAGERVEGAVTVAEAEHAVNFTPLEPWPAGDLFLIANPALEDVAGNNFRDLLDHKAGQQESDVSTSRLTIRVQNCTN